ncbi:hypothetical protein [Cellvibrio sp. UBA7661]|uniref:hypothetical protein n=1 Tax=Cellvibrio sp. UBA7661 TaxID=1946311 RepID=UPI002F3602E2
MKLIKIAAAVLISLSSLAAHAGLLYIDSPYADQVVANSNDFKFGKSMAALPSGQMYNIGGNLKANQDAVLDLEFVFLGKEAGWNNKFTSGALTNLITTGGGGSFSYSQYFAAGALIPFTFTTGGAVLPPSVANGSNNDGDHWVSFAIALDTTFKGIKYDAILFFDDTGGYNDDDNHDDLIIGLNVKTVPESSAFVLMLMGLAGLFAARRMKP